MVRYGGGWLLWQGGANKTHVAINRAWSRGRRRADNNGRLVAGRGEEKGRERFPGTVGNREGLLSGATYRRAHSATVHPFVRKHSCTVIYRLNSYNVRFSVSIVERHLARPHLAADVNANHDYVFRLSILLSDFGYRLTVIELSLCRHSQ